MLEEREKRKRGGFGTLGFFIAGLSALSWIVSFAFYESRRFDDLELGRVEGRGDSFQIFAGAGDHQLTVLHAAQAENSIRQIVQRPAAAEFAGRVARFLTSYADAGSRSQRESGRMK